MIQRKIKGAGTNKVFSGKLNKHEALSVCMFKKPSGSPSLERHGMAWRSGSPAALMPHRVCQAYMPLLPHQQRYQPF